MRLSKRVGLSLLGVLLAPAAYAQESYWSPQLALMGLNSSIRAASNGGLGITFGVVDTGVAAPWIGFNGRIDPVNSTCIIAGCPQSAALLDDHGHGTFVASQLVSTSFSWGLSGVAPNASAMSVKVLTPQGGTYQDVAKGIIHAADHGAQVINLSVAFAAVPDLISAINYAAAKNAVVVYAGGNDARAMLNNTRLGGFTDAALQRLIFMGSTGLTQQISAFSNTPGSGGLVSTTGKFTPFKKIWMVADGENIWGASNYSTPELGYGYLVQMSGTSMATPQAAGAAGLLAARWPFLVNTGQIASILLQSGQDLGAKGVDNTYGSGYVRVDKA